MTTTHEATREAWLEARLELLEREKALDRLRDELSAARRALPRVLVDKPYRFETDAGPVSLGDLFAGKRQLIVYHFMFGPDWAEGCPSCSFWADNYNGMDIHLAHLDTRLIAASNAPLAKLHAYRARMGWTFEWVSTLGSEFNHDFQVSFTAQEVAKQQMHYNFRQTSFPSSEAPGVSIFYRDPDTARVYHTYSTYARGLDMLNSAYHMIDLTPLGRQEEGKRNMHWLRRRDQYED